MASVALAQPLATNIEFWTEADATPVAIAADGPAAVLPRFTEGTGITVRVTFDEPITAVRAVSTTNGVAELDGFTPGDSSLTIDLRDVRADELAVVCLVDALSSGGINPLTEVLLAPLPGAYAPQTRGPRDFFDVLAFLDAFDAGEPSADFDRDGSLNSNDVIDLLAAVEAAESVTPFAPIVSVIEESFVPAGGWSRPVSFRIRDPFLAVEDLDVRVALPDPPVVEPEDIALMSDGNDVTLSVFAPAGTEETTSLLFVVSNGLAETDRLASVLIRPDAAPTARFTTDEFLGVAPLTIEFDASPSTDELDNIATTNWFFGDGANASGNLAVHTFNVPGEYTVTCMVTDDSGNTSTATRVITVAAAAFDHATQGGPGQISRDEASRFLWQASFGHTEQDVADVMALGYEGWIDQQLAIPATLRYPIGFVGVPDSFGKSLMNSPDQLRQRMAWALVQIITLGQTNLPQPAAYTYDVYVRHAFSHPATPVTPALTGNYRELLGEVTYGKPMGGWLTYLGNRKADPVSGTEPDENFARELMQLFSIGLWELDHEGRRITDPFGDDIPTYDMDDVRQFARVFTGFGGLITDTRITLESQPMSIKLSHHEFGPKQLLNYPGALPAGGFAPERASSLANFNFGINEALDNVFYHPSTPAFISELLIQRFTTSNPSRAYVGRVADAFRGTGPYGTGVRGDHAAIIKAILLDDEARNTTYSTNPFAGRIIEPVVFLAGAARGLEMSQLDLGTDLQEDVGQGHYRTPSVFNFYKPEFSPANTEISAAGLRAPEMQILTTSQAVGMTYAIENQILRRINGVRRWDLDIENELRALAQADSNALVARIDELFGLQVPEPTLDIIRAATEASRPNDMSGLARPNMAIFTYLASPEARILR